jgi:hypothetical protein
MLSKNLKFEYQKISLLYNHFNIDSEVNVKLIGDQFHLYDNDKLQFRLFKEIDNSQINLFSLNEFRINLESQNQISVLPKNLGLRKQEISLPQ